MKRIPAILIILCFLSGCMQSDKGMDQALNLRERLFNGNGCHFVVTITADYLNAFYTFKMRCEGDPTGQVKFEVMEPESICGITGTISSEGGNLTFDDKVLVFATLMEGQITPVTAPWLLLRAMQGGYIEGSSQEENGTTLLIDDTYADQAMQLNIRINDEAPVYAEIFWKDRRVVTMLVEGFRIL